MQLGLGLSLTNVHLFNQGKPKGGLCDAIARKVCVTATRNGKRLTLAPHIVYERRNKKRLEAVLLARDGKPVKNPKLASYLIANLSDIALTSEPFTVLPGFDPNDPEYGAQPECVVETV